LEFLQRTAIGYHPLASGRRYSHDLRPPSDPRCSGFCSHDSGHQVIRRSTLLWAPRTCWARGCLLSPLGEGDLRIRRIKAPWRLFAKFTILPAHKHHLAYYDICCSLFKHCTWLERSCVDSGEADKDIANQLDLQPRKFKRDILGQSSPSTQYRTQW
jgi:hypothetical protein